MQLKKVELIGFKSFADRTDFTFDGGITAVVGPNGCGKSNVVDAVRWVLGEQSAKSLRAAQMGDCIFAGTSTRKPLGFAEVTLTFDNRDGRIALDYDEVDLTRRIYGSGEGQYFINRRPCRLRDIKELLMGTGVGTGAYSIIEQGQVGRVIASDPKELRAIFDEAAGISLYKSRLRTTANKLDRVTANLLRAGDIIAEVEKRLRSVKYQAAKAKRFRETSERLKELKLQRARLAFQALGLRRDELDGALGESSALVESLHASVVSMETKSDDAATKLLEIEETIEGHATNLRTLERELDDLKFSIELSGERVAHQEAGRKRIEGELSAGRLELEAAEAAALGLEKRKGTILGRTDALSSAAAALEGTIRELAETASDLTARIATAEAEAVEALRAGANLNNRLSELAAAARAGGGHRLRLVDRAGQLAEAIESLEGVGEEFLGQREAVEKEAGRRRLELENVRQLKKSCIRLGDQLDSLAREASRQLAGASSKRELLGDLQKRREGVSAAAKGFLELGLPTTLGLVADLVDVPADLTFAVESLLGEAATAIVVDTTQSALAAAERMAGASGRVKIISLERARAAAAAMKARAHPFTPLAERVGCREDCGGLVEALLGDAFSAESLREAIDSNGHAAGLRVVTPAAEMLDRDGGIVVGSAGASGGLIWRRAEIERLATLEGRMQAEIERIDARRGEVGRSVDDLRERESSLEHLLSQDNARLARIEAAHAANESRVAETRREAAVVDSETTSLDEEIAKLAGEREAVGAKTREVHGRADDLQSMLVRLKGELDGIRNDGHIARARHTRLKVTLASALEKRSQIIRRSLEAKSALERLAGRLRAATAEVAAAEELVAGEKGKIERARLRLDEAGRDAEASREALAASTGRGRELRAEVSMLAPVLKRSRSELEEARASLSEISIDQREVSVRLQDIVTRAADELSVCADELAVGGEPVEDEAALDGEIAQLSKKLSSLGGVNMEALEELDELETRHAFLTGQRDDLTAAKESLEKVIRKTRATCRKMFLENFEAVREHFSNIFRRLFGGGKADCILLDPDDILESRIQIMAKPPGKELKTLTLLSGGEKAMTAVALLFAMFSTRPSPFLILDEVDAPMDESNISRFIDLMRDFLPSCQFIVITHSRRTMAAADTLYGVTMEERGVSKKVSVSFKEEPRQLAEVSA